MAELRTITQIDRNFENLLNNGTKYRIFLYVINFG